MRQRQMGTSNGPIPPNNFQWWPAPENDECLAWRDGRRAIDFVAAGRTCTVHVPPLWRSWRRTKQFLSSTCWLPGAERDRASPYGDKMRLAAVAQLFFGLQPVLFILARGAAFGLPQRPSAVGNGLM